MQPGPQNEHKLSHRGQHGGNHLGGAPQMWSAAHLRLRTPIPDTVCTGYILVVPPATT